MTVRHPAHDGSDEQKPGDVCQQRRAQRMADAAPELVCVGTIARQESGIRACSGIAVAHASLGR
jgi:hypothetical protein